MKRMAALLAGTALMMMTSTAMATVVNMGGSDNLQSVLNGITFGGVSGVNAATHFLADGSDALWTTGGTGISSATMIVELAGLANVNSFGIYDSLNVSNTAQLFGGTAMAGHKVSITFGTFDDGITSGNLLIQNLTNLGQYTIENFTSSVFGFYLNNGSNTFYSETSQNGDNFDHMVAYGKPSTPDMVKLPGNLTYTPWLESEYLLGFEDIFDGGDYDYNDLVLMVSPVDPVPEPGTMLLVGAGLLGLAIYSKHRKNA